VTVKTFSETDDRIFYTVFLMAWRDFFQKHFLKILLNGSVKMPDPHYKNFQRSGVGLIYYQS